ncbi:MAG TPA: NUDIX domain-containing protein [Patescibacteria group bacterium]|nr:NUDIX domain-containing protein [Patescibacteria group bacterium]
MITCYFENGNKDNLRHVAVGAIILKDGKVLLTKRGFYQGKPIPEHGKWDIVGGYLDRNENLQEGVKREAKEEVGIAIEDINLFRINDSPNRKMEDKQNLDMIFIAKTQEEVKIATEEVLEYSWFDLKNLPSKDQFAFDHLESVELYKKYLKENFTLPILG